MGFFKKLRKRISKLKRFVKRSSTDATSQCAKCVELKREISGKPLIINFNIVIIKMGTFWGLFSYNESVYVWQTQTDVGVSY